MTGLWGVLILALGASADHAFAPPMTKSALDASLRPIPEERVAEYLANQTREFVFRDFEGRNEQLKAEAADKSGPFRVGRGLNARIEAEDLFQDAFDDGTYYVFLGGVASSDARSIRLRVDLSELADDEELWLVDPAGLRPFGPHTRGDHVEGGRWLPTVEGERAVLLVRSARPDPPQVSLVGVAHFFWDLVELKQPSCNVHIECETDPALQDVSRAVGIMVVPNGGDMALCSGTLLNNPDTPELEPYFLTSNHCVPDFAQASQVDIIWDFRASNCAGNGIPSLSSLPRSEGRSTLATSSRLDATLMRLDDVPAGTEGRTYAGWDTVTPAQNEAVSCIHHPEGAAMRISEGRIIGVNLATARFGYRNQTEAVWDTGVTEPGSSGSCLLRAASGYRVIGTLSNGALHSCGSDRSGNTDRFSSFRHFYEETDAKDYLSGTTPPSGGGGIVCPAEKALRDNPERIENLRAFRDRALKTSALGRGIVQVYYAFAPGAASLVDRSAWFRDAFAAVAEPFADLGRLLRSE
jgi:hypothetical protein